MSLYTFTDEQQKIREWWLNLRIFHYGILILIDFYQLLFCFVNPSAELSLSRIFKIILSASFTLLIFYCFYTCAYKNPGTKLLTFELFSPILLVIIVIWGKGWHTFIALWEENYLSLPWYQLVWDALLTIYGLFASYLDFKLRQINLYIKNEALFSSDVYIQSVRSLKEAKTFQELEKCFFEIIKDKPEYALKPLRKHFEDRACEFHK